MRKEVCNHGATTTRGLNELVLDNRGEVDTWTAKAPVTSFESSGIGFVDFGDIDSMDIDAPIETHGLGARGFDLYDGSPNDAKFRDIATHGDGAVGVRLSKPFGTITIDGNIVTDGGAGESLVRGKVVHLEAHGSSLKPGAEGRSLIVTGKVGARNAEISDFDLAAAASVIERLEVNGETLDRALVVRPFEHGPAADAVHRRRSHPVDRVEELPPWRVTDASRTAPS